jgi:hypothetical protein
MIENTLWLDALNVFAMMFKICNMHVERLFARARLNSRHSNHQVPVLEGLRSSAFLSEVLGSHCRQGGFDPRVQHRQALLARGVRFRVKKKTKVATRISGFSVFTGKQMAKRKREKIALGGRRDFFGKLSSEWRGLPEHEKNSYTEEAFAKRQRVEPPSEPAPGGRQDITISGGFWGLSSQEQPITEDNFVRTVISEMNVQSLPSANQYSQHFRKTFLKGAVVRDADEIKPGTRYAMRRPCWRYHAGLCRSDDPVFYREILSLGTSMARRMDHCTGARQNWLLLLPQKTRTWVER